ncbi:MAG: RNA polymerase sigma factor [Acidobacteriota bacterium]
MLGEIALENRLAARAPLKKRTGPDDNVLIQEFIEGNEQAFVLIVGRYKDPLVHYINSIIRDYDMAADLTQETFIRVFRKASQYERKYQFSTWVYRIATNLAIDELRNRKKRGRFFFFNAFPNFIDEENNRTLQLADSGPTPDRSLDRKEASGRLAVAIDGLPEKYRIVFLLREVQEMSHQEIGAVLSLSEGTVKSRLHRARLLLRTKLEGILGKNYA